MNKWFYLIRFPVYSFIFRLAITSYCISQPITIFPSPPNQPTQCPSLSNLLIFDGTYSHHTGWIDRLRKSNGWSIEFNLPPTALIVWEKISHIVSHCLIVPPAHTLLVLLSPSLLPSEPIYNAFTLYFNKHKVRECMSFWGDASLDASAYLGAMSAWEWIATW